jgi:hypothetical protein
VSIDDFEERKKVCHTKDHQWIDDEVSRESARWDDCVIIDLIKLRWDAEITVIVILPLLLSHSFHQRLRVLQGLHATQN